MRTAKGREMAAPVRELVSEDDTWIGRLSEHSSAEGSWEDFLVSLPSLPDARKQVSSLSLSSASVFCLRIC